MSKEPFFSKLFGPSPITPIQHHMAVCEECAQSLKPYFEAALAGDWSKAEEHYEQTAAKEREADDLKRQIRMNLSRSLFLPVSRNNLLEVLQIQDGIANHAKDIAGLVLGRQMSFPGSLHEQFMNFLCISINAVRLAREAMDELNDLIDSGFSGQEIGFIQDILDKVHDAEHESDLQQIAMRKSLYDIESELNPVDVMFMYKIFDLIGDMADNSQTVGNRMLYLAS